MRKNSILTCHCSATILVLTLPSSNSVDILRLTEAIHMAVWKMLPLRWFQYTTMVNGKKIYKFNVSALRHKQAFKSWALNFATAEPCDWKIVSTTSSPHGRRFSAWQRQQMAMEFRNNFYLSPFAFDGICANDSECSNKNSEFLAFSDRQTLRKCIDLIYVVVL